MRNRCIAACVALAVVLGAACSSKSPVDPETQTVDPCTVNPCSAAAVVAQLGAAYAALDFERFAPLLHPDFVFYTHPDTWSAGGLRSWGRTEELQLHIRLFQPERLPPSEDATPAERSLHAVTIVLELEPLVERTEYYASESNPAGLDSARFQAWGANCSHSVLFEMASSSDYIANGTSFFVIVEDRTKAPHESGAFALYRWHDLPSSAAVRPVTWTELKWLAFGEESW